MGKIKYSASGQGGCEKVGFYERVDKMAQVPFEKRGCVGQGHERQKDEGHLLPESQETSKKYKTIAQRADDGQD